MKTKKGTYDFSYVPRTEGFGFEIYTDEEGAHRFVLKDGEGQAFLFSQGYRSKKSRDNGIKSVVTNAVDGERYIKDETDEGKPFFILRAGNNQEIARSRAFDSRRERNNKLELLGEMNESVAIQEPKNAEKEDRPEAAGEEGPTKAEKAEKKAGKRPRYKFTITYYPDSGIWNVKHDESGEVFSSEKLDGVAITEFIQGHVPPPEKKKQPSPASRNIPDSLKERPSPVKVQTLSDMESNRPTDFVKHDESFQIVLSLDTPVSDRVKSRPYTAKVLAKSLRDDRNVLVSKKDDQLDPSEPITLPVYANQLRPGMYRLQVQLSLNTKGDATQSLEGSKLLLVH